jgi:triosephosphate isomerase
MESKVESTQGSISATFHHSARDDIVQVFKKWDTNKDGFISRESLVEILAKVGMKESDANAFMSTVSTSDQLQYADFVEWLCFPKAMVQSGVVPLNASFLGRTSKFFVGTNWKCSLESIESVDSLIADLNKMWLDDGASMSDVELCILPPYVFLDRVRQQLHPEIRVGSQNAWDAAPGFTSTGVISAEMMHSIGCRWVLLGHSDRRNILGESDTLIHDKVTKCLEAGLSVNLTIGETREARDAGNAISTLVDQLSAAVAHVPGDAWGRIALAYEPVWAIGEGATPCTPEETQRVLAALRAWIRDNAGPDAARACRLLYTGSVNENNAEVYARLPDVDGFVVGRAGLDISKLKSICKSLPKCNVPAGL